jgi:hypothetical protein
VLPLLVHLRPSRDSAEVTNLLASVGALLQPPEGRDLFVLSPTRTCDHPRRPLPTANQSLAKHNRKPSQIIENNHHRPKSIASSCRLLAVVLYLAAPAFRIRAIGVKNVPNFQRYMNAACLGLLVVLTCPAAWGQIGWAARTETSAMATGV